MTEPPAEAYALSRVKLLEVVTSASVATRLTLLQAISAHDYKAVREMSVMSDKTPTKRLQVLQMTICGGRGVRFGIL